MMDRVFFALHVAVFILGLIIPFSSNREWLSLYSLLIPFLLLHWALNDDTCALTQLEVAVSGRPKERTFIGRFIGPIYNLPDDQLGKLVKCIFFVMWLVVQYRLGRLF